MAVACAKHKVALTQKISVDGIEAFRTKFDEIWMRTQKTDKTTGEKSRCEPRLRKFIRKLRNPSNHASYENKRSGGGRAEFIHHILQKEIYDESLYQFGHDDNKFHCHFVPNDDLYDMFDNGFYTVSRYGVPLITYDSALERALSSMGFNEATYGDFSGGFPFTGWLEEPDPEKFIRSKTETRPLRAKVELCLEPLKCRVITKGESLPYWVSQTFQKKAWLSLQDCPCFALTGTPVDSSHLYWLESQTKELELDFDKWVSGDYSAATDGLSAEVNQMAVGSLCEAFEATPEETHLCSKVLGNHQVEYPRSVIPDANELGLDVKPFTMQNGQLRGSLLSFPELCAINLVAYWCALEEYTGKTFLKEQLPCLINGDDILFKSNDAFYPIWQKWITRAGFTLSVGKNYISPHFITVNSESWLRLNNGHFKKLKWLNCGLLLQEAFGPHKIPLRSETAERPLVPKLQWVLDNCVNTKRTYDRLKHYWRKSISIWTRNGYYNLAAPTEWGGCGLKLPPELREDTKFTYTQQAIAGYARVRQKAFVGKFFRDVPQCGLDRVVHVDTVPKEDVVRRNGGILVRRAKDEPLHVGERRFKDPSCSQRVAAELLNCQITTSGEQVSFRIKELAQRRIDQSFKFAKQGYTIKHPFENDKEHRIFNQPLGPTDDASQLLSMSGPLCDTVESITSGTHALEEKMAEMTTDKSIVETIVPSPPPLERESPLMRTDSVSQFYQLCPLPEGWQ
jgi:hypothetical protein